jgi:dTDP-4-dehydrorhamnose reductase
VKVAPPIIHSYRNLESRPSTTGNFPTALFMGRDKKEAIDEIRHEEVTENVPTYIIFGANGRLGKSFVKELYNQIGFHKYNVIPIYDKISKNNVSAIRDMFKSLSKVTYEKVLFINCSGVTNVQKSDELADDMKWTNTELPVLFAEECSSRGWNMIQFSSDYVFQQINKNGDPLSSYTMSKKEMEDRINNLDSDVSKNITVTIVRVANLFSTDAADTHNMIKKIEDRLKVNGSITIDPNLIVTPTDVNVVSKAIVTSIINDEDLYITNSGVKNINLISKTPYNLKTLINKFYKCENIKETTGQIDPWFDNFNKEDVKTTIIEIESSDSSIEKILKV